MVKKTCSITLCHQQCRQMLINDWCFPKEKASNSSSISVSWCHHALEKNVNTESVRYFIVIDKWGPPTYLLSSLIWLIASTSFSIKSWQGLFTYWVSDSNALLWKIHRAFFNLSLLPNFLSSKFERNHYHMANIKMFNLPGSYHYLISFDQLEMKNYEWKEPNLTKASMKKSAEPPFNVWWWCR